MAPIPNPAPAPPPATDISSLRKQYLYANQHRELILVLVCIGVAVVLPFLRSRTPEFLLLTLAVWTLFTLLLPLLALRLRLYSSLLALIWMQLFLELQFITLLYMTDGLHPGIALYFFTLIFAFFSLPERLAYLLTGVALADYLALIWLTRSAHPAALSDFGLIFRICVLLVAAFSLGRMTRLLRQQGLALARNRLDLARAGRRLAEQQHALEEQFRIRTRDLNAANIQLRHSHQELLRLYDLQGSFVASLSHEVCTPLTAVRSFAELLANEPPPPARREFLAIIQNESRRLEQLILDLLELARLQTGRMLLNRKSLHLDELVLTAADELRVAAAHSGVELRLELRETALPTIVGDERRLLLVLTRLLQNALKYTAGAPVRIGTGLRANELLCWVADGGPTLTAEERENLFNRFYQIRESLQPKPRGGGLDLALCHEIMGRHGGRIWVESPPKGGNCFVCAFPLAELPASAPPGE